MTHRPFHVVAKHKRKHALVIKGFRAQSPFSLKLPRSGRATVSLTVTLESGRRYTSRRTYRLC